MQASLPMELLVYFNYRGHIIKMILTFEIYHHTKLEFMLKNKQTNLIDDLDFLGQDSGDGSFWNVFDLLCHLII
jgi:hypothetical protein